MCGVPPQAYNRIKQLLAVEFPGRVENGAMGARPAALLERGSGGGRQGEGTGLTVRALARMFGICAAQLLRTGELTWEQV